ncbi:glycosyltransferase [Zhouia sp. PK063]|uniref:glycosyltransferase n=1 Tax=Zhouia sp. PK063 TaxID=3373602 RepID=UPI0037B721BC
MKIVFDPKKGETNNYIDIIVNSLQQEGIEVYSSKEAFSSIKLFCSIKLFHFNWIENAQGVKLFKQFLKIIFLKCINKKIIWTLHNKQPHDNKLIFGFNFIRFLIMVSDIIIIHSKVSSDVILETSKSNKYLRKIKYIPHPNYIISYSENDLCKHEVTNDSRLKLLFIGAIKPYKNLEVLLEIIKELNDQVELTIAGKSSHEDYFESLLKIKGNSKNIILKNKFLNDDEMKSFIKSSDLLVLPYDITSSLNSGTVILAFSNKRSVICPAIGTILDLKNKESLISYDYKNIDDHKKQLRKSIFKALKIKVENENKFFEWGEKLFNEMIENNDPNSIAKKLSDIYKI